MSLLSRLAVRIPRVRQHDRADCGAAALRSVALHFGLDVPLSRIRQAARTDRSGTTMLGLIEGAEALGLNARGVRATWEGLCELPLPAIAHVVTPVGLHHYLAVYRIDRRGVMVMDPAEGRVLRRSHAEFQRDWSGVLLLVDGVRRDDPGARGEKRDRGWALARPHHRALAEALFGALLCTVLGLAPAIYIQKVVDHVIGGGNLQLLNLMSVAMLAVIALQVYLNAVRASIVLRTGLRIDADLVLGYYRQLLRLPAPFFDSMRTGEILARIGDAGKVRALVSGLALDLAVNVLVVVLSLALMLAYSPRLALVVGATIPLYAAVLALANRANRRNQRSVMERAAELESHLVESVAAMATVRALGLEAPSELRAEARVVRLLRAVRRAGGTAIGASSAAELLGRTATVAVVWAGAPLVIGQSLSPGELMSFYALVGHLTGPVSSIIGANQGVQDALVALDRLGDVLDLEPEPSGGVELLPARIGDLRFREVTFRYGARPPVLHGLNLIIPRGQVTAIVGESGSGKSTIAALLHKLHPLESGQVAIGELDLRYVDACSLRRSIGMVPQRVVLFAGSIASNIAAGEPIPDMERVLHAARRVGVLELIESLPQGFATEIGDDGLTLSGGQRQRIALARVLYRDPPILVLDEATSALDALSEQQIQRCLRELRAEGKTIVQIAHRLAIARDADWIVVVEGGRVAEEGTHEELLRRGGSYERMWRLQARSVEMAATA